MPGGFRAAFKGNGIEFDEVRRYESGDDVRSIDRNVSARFGVPYIKLYREDREMCVCVVLDCSASMFSGVSAPLTRYEQAVFCAALVAFSAEYAGQKMCALFFDAETRTVFKPRRGRAHTMAFIGAALSANPHSKGTSLSSALKSASNVLKRRGVVVVVSDFLAVDWERDFNALCIKHDCIAIKIKDPVEDAFPKTGLLPIEDPETGKTLLAPSNSARFRLEWAEWHEKRRQNWLSICKSCGASGVEISTDEDAGAALQRFFRNRRKK